MTNADLHYKWAQQMDEKILYEYIGKKIKTLREAAGFTQEGLAGSIQISRASIANYESGKKAISFFDLYRLADVLKAAITDLVPSVEEIKEKSAPEQLLEKAENLKEEEKKEIRTFIENQS